MTTRSDPLLGGLLGLHVAALALVVGALAWLGRPGPPAGPIDPAHARAVLDARTEQALQGTTGALDEVARRDLTNLVGLQVQAADHLLLSLAWGEPRTEGGVEARPLTLLVEGDPLNLPILIDELYKQRHPVVLTGMALVLTGEDRTRTRVHARIFGPGPAPEVQGGDPALREALAAAARTRHAEDLQALWPTLKALSQENRRQISRALPATVMGLPRAPRGWLGLVVEEGRAAPLAGERPTPARSRRARR